MSRLLRRSLLLPGESLLSFLTRVAVLNYIPVGWLTTLMRQDERNPLAYGTGLENLSKLTDVDALTLYTASHHSFASVFCWPKGASMSIEVRGVHLPLL